MTAEFHFSTVISSFFLVFYGDFQIFPHFLTISSLAALPILTGIPEDLVTK